MNERGEETSDFYYGESFSLPPPSLWVFSPPPPRDLFRVLLLKGVNRGEEESYRGRKWGNREMRMVQMAQEVEKGKTGDDRDFMPSVRGKARRHVGKTAWAGGD